MDPSIITGLEYRERVRSQAGKEKKRDFHVRIKR